MCDESQERAWESSNTAYILTSTYQVSWCIKWFDRESQGIVQCSLVEFCMFQHYLSVRLVGIMNPTMKIRIQHWRWRPVRSYESCSVKSYTLKQSHCFSIFLYFGSHYLSLFWNGFQNPSGFGSPVCRVVKTDSWLRSGSSLGHFLPSQSRRHNVLYAQGALTLILNLSLTHENFIPLRLPAKNSGLFRPYCVFLSVPSSF